MRKTPTDIVRGWHLSGSGPSAVAAASWEQGKGRVEARIYWDDNDGCGGSFTVENPGGRAIMVRIHESVLRALKERSGAQ